MPTARGKGGFISKGIDPVQAPDAPTAVSGTAGDEEVSIAFTAPSDVGGAAIDTYIAVAANTSTGVSTSNTGASSPITVSSLTNDVAHSIKVYAQNVFGTSIAGTGTNVTPAFVEIGVYSAGSNNVISRITFATAGNATDFGDLTVARGPIATASSSTRGVFIGGSSGTVIDYVTIATAGNATDFGDISAGFQNPRGCSNSTRGVFSAGTISGNVSATMHYITIASTGNSTSFGNLTLARSNHASNVASTTRGVFAGGQGQDGDPVYDTIDYITIASTGNATDFGNLSTTTRNLAGASSSTRGLFAGGTSTDPSTRFDTISYITIASTGNTTDFGDLAAGTSIPGGGAGTVRAVFVGGQQTDGTSTDVISFVTIASTGNATDFGDMISAESNGVVASNAHGGIS